MEEENLRKEREEEERMRLEKEEEEKMRLEKEKEETMRLEKEEEERMRLEKEEEERIRLEKEEEERMRLEKEEEERMRLEKEEEERIRLEKEEEERMRMEKEEMEGPRKKREEEKRMRKDNDRLRIEREKEKVEKVRMRIETDEEERLREGREEEKIMLMEKEKETNSNNMETEERMSESREEEIIKKKRKEEEIVTNEREEEQGILVWKKKLTKYMKLREAGQDKKRKVTEPEITSGREEKKRKKPETNKGKQEKRKKLDLSVWQDIHSFDDLKNTAVLTQVESRLAPRRSKQDVTPFYDVSGEMFANWIGPPEGLSAMAVQETLRMGHTHPNRKEVGRVHKIVSHNRALPKKEQIGPTYFSKLHPADVHGLAGSMALVGVAVIPSSLHAKLPGHTQAERKVNAAKAVSIVEDAISAVKTSTFDQVTHGGVALIESTWQILRSIISNGLNAEQL